MVIRVAKWVTTVHTTVRRNPMRLTDVVTPDPPPTKPLPDLPDTPPPPLDPVVEMP